MRDRTAGALRLIRGGRRDGDGRETVDIFRHDTGSVGSVVWSLSRLLATIARRRPRRSTNPEWTFSVGRGHRRLAILTEGASRFSGQHPLWTDTGRAAGAMIFSALSFADVRRVLERFYASTPADGCFDGLAGQETPTCTGSSMATTSSCAPHGSPTSTTTTARPAARP